MTREPRPTRYEPADATEARQAARQSAELFSKALDFSPINMTITRVSDGTFLAVNATDDVVQGYTPAELVGRTSVDAGVWRRRWLLM